MNGQKVTIYDDKLVCVNSGKFFTLRGDLLKLITDLKSNTTGSPDANPIVEFLVEIHFEIYARGKSLRDRNLAKNFFNKRAVLASGLKRSETVIFLSQSPNELCKRLCLINQEKQAGNDANRFDNESTAINDKLLEYKCINATQHKKNHEKTILL